MNRTISKVAEKSAIVSFLFISACAGPKADKERPVKPECAIDQPAKGTNTRNVIAIFRKEISTEYVRIKLDKCERPKLDIFFDQVAFSTLSHLRNNPENQNASLFILEISYEIVSIPRLHERPREILLVDTVENMAPYAEDDFVANLYDFE